MVMHYAGYPCNMDEICKIAEEHNLLLLKMLAMDRYLSIMDANWVPLVILAVSAFSQTRILVPAKAG